jgi:hypothetical protein
MTQRQAIAVVKVALLFVGLWLLLKPERPGPNAAYHRGQVIAKAGGALLLVLAAIPYRAPGDSDVPQDGAEDL